MKFKVTIRKKPILADGTTNVKIRVTHDHKTRYIATDYYVIPKFFDKNLGLIKPGGEFTQDKAERANAKLQIKTGQLAEKAMNIKNRHDIKNIMEVLRDKRTTVDVYSIMDDRLSKFEQGGNLNYRTIIKSTKNSIEKFNGSGRLSFDSITYTWLSRFEIWLRANSISPNSIGIKMREIRTVYNQAITMGYADLSSYPFRKYKIPRESTRKRNLTAEEINLISKIDIPNQLMRWSRDMTMLSFYLIGINMKDMFYLKGIEEGRVYYIRSKGKRAYSIKVWPEAEAIIKKYKGKKYLLNVLDNYADYRTASKRINYKLKDIAKLCKIDKPVSTYWMRHSFATIGTRIGISRDVIRYALGHSTNTVSDIYIEPDLAQIDDAMRQIISYIASCNIQSGPPENG